MPARDLTSTSSLFDRLDALDRTRATYIPQPGTAQRVGQFASRYPWMSGGVNLALAETGADDDFAEQVATEEAAHRHKRGFGWHSISDALTSAGGIASDIVKPVARAAFTALETPVQEFKSLTQIAGATGYGTPLGEAIRESGLGESTGLQALQAIARGDKVDLGRGYFSGGDIREHYQTESARLRHHGQSITAGRVLANAVTEPGTTPYNLLSGLTDAAFEFYADPTAIALGKAGDLNRARKLLVDEAGVVKGLRSTVISERAAQWLGSRSGRRTIEAIAGERDIDALWRMLGKKPSVQHLVALADARTPEEVTGVLEPLLGIDNAFREIPTITRPHGRGAFQAVFGRDPLDIRAFGEVPRGHLDFSRPNDALETFDAWQLNAKVPHAVRSANNTALARAMAGGSGIDRYEVVVKKGAKAVRDALEIHGADPRRARELTKLFVDSHSDAVKYLIDDTGAEMSFRKVVIDGVEHDLPAPFWLAQSLASKIELPDARKIRRVATNPVFQKITSRGGQALGEQRVPIAAMDSLIQDLWKPITLLRGAWPVRVIGEEQVRIGASGLRSAFSHPISYLGWVLGSEERAAGVAERLGVKVGRGELDVLGRNIAEESRFLDDADEFGAAMNRRAAQWSGREPKKVTVGDWHVYDRADDEFHWWWSDNLMQVSSDPVAQRIAGGLRAGDRVPAMEGPGPTGLDAVKHWFFEGSGRGFRKDLEKIHPELGVRGGADAYIDKGFTELQRLTGGDDDLLEFVSTRRFRGGRPVRYGPSEEMADYLADHVDDLAPQKVKGLKTVRRGMDENAAIEWKNKAVDWAFSSLMGRPSSYLSRSPVFRQRYWQRGEELIEAMTPKAQEAMIEAARAARLPERNIERLVKRAARGSGEVALDDADVIAKHYALDKTRDLLYDLHNRNQFFDAARLVFPFGEAWKEVVGTWAKLSLAHPQIPRRAQQIIEAARGNDTDPNSGFFHTNEFGEEVFTYPGSQWLTEKTLGVPVPLEGRVQGLNIMASVVPGFGPAVSVGAAYLLPDKPEWDSIRQIVMPFGEPDTGGGFAEAFLPPWMQKLRQGLGEPADQRLFANTVMDMQRYLLTTGDYSTDSPEQIQRLMGDAKHKAKMLYVLRGMAQFGAPSAPTPRMLVHDKSGDLVFLSKLSDEWEKLQQDDYRTATGKFLDRYGERALLVMQSKTQILSYGSPVDDKGLRWRRENDDLAALFPHTYGLFGPQGGKFSSEAYARSIENGDRVALTPEQAIRLGNTRVANLVYHKAKDVLGPRPTAQGQTALRLLRGLLIQRYPGFGDDIVLKTNTDTLIRELQTAVANPKIVATDAGKGLAAYMTARSLAEKLSTDRGFSPTGFRSSPAMSDVREALRSIADVISQRYPDFAATFDQVLSRELTDDEPALAVA